MTSSHTPGWVEAWDKQNGVCVCLCNKEFEPITTATTLLTFCFCLRVVSPPGRCPLQSFTVCGKHFLKRKSQCKIWHHINMHNKRFLFFLTSPARRHVSNVSAVQSHSVLQETLTILFVLIGQNPVLFSGGSGL